MIINVAGAGEEISTRPFQLVTGRVWRGSAFGGVRGRTELPGYVERAQRGEIPLDTFITHTMGLQDINDESWGLDNVSVATNAVPAPGALALAGVGLGLLARRRR